MRMETFFERTFEYKPQRNWLEHKCWYSARLLEWFWKFDYFVIDEIVPNSKVLWKPALLNVNQKRLTLEIY